MSVLCFLLQLYVVVLFVRIVLSWFPMQPGTGMATVYSYLRSVTDPVLEPLRRAIPPVGGVFDLSPLIVVLVIQVLLVPIVC